MATITKADLLNPNGRLMPMLEEQAAHRRKHDAVIVGSPGTELEFAL